MDFAGQIRAARAYLNLTQDQLANAAELSVQGMQKIERGETQPTARTQNKIIKALEKLGLTFTSKGIEYTQYPIFIIEDETQELAYLKVLEDVAEHLSIAKNKELLLMYSDDKVSPPAVNKIYRSLRTDGVKMRQLVQDGNKHLMGAIDEYRYVPKNFFINHVILIYGNRVVSEAGNGKQYVVRVDNTSAEIQRNTFDMLWSVLKQPTKTIADETF